MKRQIINKKDAILELESMDLEVEELNSYQFRIRCPDTSVFWDWYHTTGSLVENDRGTNRRDGTYKDIVDLVRHISERIYRMI